MSFFCLGWLLFSYYVSENIGMDGWFGKWQFFLTLCIANVFRSKVGDSKQYKNIHTNFSPLLIRFRDKELKTPVYHMTKQVKDYCSQFINSIKCLYKCHWTCCKVDKVDQSWVPTQSSYQYTHKALSGSTKWEPCCKMGNGVSNSWIQN